MYTSSNFPTWASRTDDQDGDGLDDIWAGASLYSTATGYVELFTGSAATGLHSTGTLTRTGHVGTAFGYIIARRILLPRWLGSS
jgi:hypothetical protein